MNEGGRVFSKFILVLILLTAGGVGGYFVLTGRKPDEAVQLVKQKRPEIHLENSQITALEEFWREVVRDGKSGKN